MGKAQSNRRLQKKIENFFLENCVILFFNCSTAHNNSIDSRLAVRIFQQSIQSGQGHLFRYRKNNDQRQTLHTKAVLRFIWKILLLLSILFIIISWFFTFISLSHICDTIETVLYHCVHTAHMFTICINIVFADDQIT